jgi:hypothetical protein
MLSRFLLVDTRRGGIGFRKPWKAKEATHHNKVVRLKWEEDNDRLRCIWHEDKLNMEGGDVLAQEIEKGQDRDMHLDSRVFEEGK